MLVNERKRDGSLIELFDSLTRDRDENLQIVPLLLEHMGRYREIPTPGPDDWLSASKVPGWCPRYHVMVYRMGIEKMIDESDRNLVYRADLGTAVHSIIQSRWLGPMGLLFGGWRCPQCGHCWGVGKDRDPWSVTVETSVRIPKKCDCGFKQNDFDFFEFLEPVIRDTKWKVRGKTDGILVPPISPVEIADVKTVTGLDYVKDGPRDKDVSQIHWYLGPSRIKTGRLIYFWPGAKKIEDAIIEHQVRFDQHRWHREQEKMRGLREALQDPRRPIPHCPYGGEGSFGECPCRDMEVRWPGHGYRSVPDEHRDSGPA